ASTRRELRSAATSTSTTAIDLIRALTDARPIKPTSTRCLSARRPNPGRGSTYRRGNSVQTTAATSQPCSSLSSCLCEILSTRAARGADVGASEHMIGAVSALTLSTAAFAQQGPQEARAMLDKAIAAVKADPVVAIAMFIKGEGGFRDRDLYPFC